MLFSTVFLGTCSFSSAYLKALFKSPHFKITSVITQPDRKAKRGFKLQSSEVKKTSKDLNLNCLSFENVNTEQARSEIKKLKADLCIVVSFGQILKNDFINMFPKGVFNIHASLLPLYRGASPVETALMNGDSKTGVSLQKINEKLDAGDIISQKECLIPENMNALELYEALEKQASFFWDDSLPKYLKAEISPWKQDENLVSWSYKISKKQSEIDWNESASHIHNKIRSLVKGPQAYFNFQGKRVKVLKSKKSSLKASPGEIIHTEKDFFVLACGQQSIEIVSVKPESKKEMSGGDFARGYHLKKGERLS